VWRGVGATDDVLARAKYMFRNTPTLSTQLHHHQYIQMVCMYNVYTCTCILYIVRTWPHLGFYSANSHALHSPKSCTITCLDIVHQSGCTFLMENIPKYSTRVPGTQCGSVQCGPANARYQDCHELSAVQTHLTTCTIKHGLATKQSLK
jgi:hypothetical protein